MIDFEAARIKMVDNQIRTVDVTSYSVLQAFLAVPREDYVSEKARPLAYIDTDIEVSPGRFLMEASPLAKLLQMAAITKTDKVLEIGAGSGYVSALLSRLAETVVAVESDPELADRAKRALEADAHTNVTVVHGDLEKGCPEKAPFDLIFVNGAVEELPEALLEQLGEGGRLVAVVGYGNAAQAKLLLRERGVISETSRFNLSVKPLPGFRKAKDFVF